MKRVLLPIMIGVMTTAAAETMAAPQIGDKAPPIKVARWMNEKPPALPGETMAGKHVFVIEFWATWCRPCWLSIPHLAELHDKHAKDGLVVIGVSNEEPDVIRTFMASKTQGVKRDMPYYVGSDDKTATTEAWMKGVPGIPHAFVVNPSGLVVWQGNPLDAKGDAKELDRVVERVLAGRYDVDAAKKAADVERKFNEVLVQLQQAYAARDADRLFKLVDEAIALKPRELQVYLIKRQLLSEFGRQREAPAWNAAIVEAFNNSPDALREIVRSELAKDRSQRDAELLVRCILQVARLHQGQDAETLEMLARVQAEAGLIDAALATQAQAEAVAPEAERARHRRGLEYYLAMKRLAADLSAVAPASQPASEPTSQP